jgi:hypothetical protein
MKTTAAFAAAEAMIFASEGLTPVTTTPEAYSSGRIHFGLDKLQ